MSRNMTRQNTKNNEWHQRQQLQIRIWRSI